MAVSDKPTESQRDAPANGGLQERVVSVDALRGFDMFWIVGGEQVAHALEGIGGGPIVSTLATQLKHAEWEGLRSYDVIFPLFLFLIGVSIVLSMDRLLRKSGRSGAIVRIVRRSALLFAIGVFYYGGLTRKWPDIQLSGVLHRIALCYFIAALLYVFLRKKGIVIAAAVCLIGYWALLMFVPFHDVDLKHDKLKRKASQAQMVSAEEMLGGVEQRVSGTFEEGRNLAHYVDYRWLPGRKRNLHYTNEGLLSTIGAVATTLFGIMAGWVITASSLSKRRKVLWLIGGGAVCVGLGMIWGMQCPIIKRIWTPSYCLAASGYSAMLLGMFYLLIDVCQWKRWCTPFLWIGANALFIYLAVNLIDFTAIARRMAGGDVTEFVDVRLGDGVGDLMVAVIALALPVFLVRYLYQRRLFVRL